jgi:hypothetical protein
MSAMDDGQPMATCHLSIGATQNDVDANKKQTTNIVHEGLIDKIS